MTRLLGDDVVLSRFLWEAFAQKPRQIFSIEKSKPHGSGVIPKISIARDLREKSRHITPEKRGRVIPSEVEESHATDS